MLHSFFAYAGDQAPELLREAEPVAYSLAPPASAPSLGQPKGSEPKPSSGPRSSAPPRERHHLGIRGRVILGTRGRHHFGMRGRLPSESAPSGSRCLR
jgi:hypothetical protein